MLLQSGPATKLEGSKAPKTSVSFDLTFQYFVKNVAIRVAPSFKEPEFNLLHFITCHATFYPYPINGKKIERHWTHFLISQNMEFRPKKKSNFH